MQRQSKKRVSFLLNSPI